MGAFMRIFITNFHSVKCQREEIKKIMRFNNCVERILHTCATPDILMNIQQQRNFVKTLVRDRRVFITFNNRFIYC